MPNPDQRQGPRTLNHGRFLLTERIGQGGMAVVWRARDTHLRVERAIKIITRQGNAGRIRAERLLREARAMTLLKHRHILTVYEHAESEEGPYVVMDYVPGGTLDDRLRESGPLAPRQAVRWVIEILSALEHAHSKGVVHRDVKPSNILVDATGAALLADFGIALLTDDDERHTRTGISMGSVAFMAPEQRLDARSVGPGADIYSTAATLYHLVTASTPVDLFAADASSPRWADVPEVLRPILFRATRQDPERRFPTATALRRALASVVDELTDAPAGRFVRVDGNTVSGERVLTGPAQAIGRLSTMDGTAAPEHDLEVGQLVRVGGLVLVVAFAVVTIGLVMMSAGSSGAPPPSVPPPPSAAATAPPTPVELPAPVVAEAPIVPMTPAPPAGEIRAPALSPPEKSEKRGVPAPPQADPPAAPADPKLITPRTAAGGPPGEWLGFLPGTPPETRAAVAGRWRGGFGPYQLYLTLDGADGALRGTCWVQIEQGGRVEVHPVAGRLEGGVLTLSDEDGGSGAGRYELKLDNDGALDGKWVARQAGPTGAQLVPVHATRVGAR